MATTVQTPATRHPLQDQLAALRQKLRLTVTLRGLGLLITVVAVSVATAGALDWWLNLPSLARALLLVGTLCLSGYVAVRHLVLPLLQRTDDLSLALQIEERFPSLNDALASTVEFLHQTDDDVTDSTSLRQEAQRRLEARLEAYDFKRVIDSRGLRSTLVSAVLAIAALIFLSAAFPAKASMAFARFSDPFGAHAWPTQTQIELAEFPERIGRNEAFELRGTIRGAIPEQVIVTYRTENGQETQTPIALAEDPATGLAEFVSVYEPGYVDRRFSFKVAANDAETDWHEVEVLPPPRLVASNGQSSPRIRLVYPRYLGRNPDYKVLPAGKGEINAPNGTVVSLRATADRDLSAAWIEFEPEDENLKGRLMTFPFGHLTLNEICGDRPARLETPRTFFVSFRPVVSGRYKIAFRDTTGLRGDVTYSLTVVLDEAPEVTLERPSLARDQITLEGSSAPGIYVLQQAKLPLQLFVDDKRHGSRSVWLEHRLDRLGASGIQHTWLRHPGIEAAQLLLAPAGLPQWPFLLDGVGPIVMRRIDRHLLVSSLRRPDGGPVQPGDVVKIRACADDFDDVSPNKQPGCKEVQLYVVHKDVLELWLNKEQKEIQDKLNDVKRKQQLAKDLVEEVKNAAAETMKLTVEDRAKLEKAQRIQEDVARDVADPDDTKALRNRVERVLRSVRQNQLPRTGVEQRMTRAANELQRVSEQELRRIEEQLARLQHQEQQKVLTPQKRADRVQQAAEQAEQQAQQMQRQAQSTADNEQQRAMLQTQAQQLRQQAAQLRRMADAMRQEEKTPPMNSRQMAEARQRQLEQMGREQGQMEQQLRQAASRDVQGRDQALNRQADAMRQSAEQLRAAANEERRSQLNPEQELLERLDKTRADQGEVQKTISDLLKEMEPWSRLSDVQSESRSILNQQRELLQRIEEMKKDGLLGKDPDELTGSEKAKLHRIAEQQDQLQQRTNDLLQKMQRMSDERLKKGTDEDKATAQDLDQARAQAEKDGQDNQPNLPGAMKQAGEQIRRNQLSNAADNQKKAIDKLEKLVDNLRDGGEMELARQQKKLGEHHELLKKIEEEVTQLRRKIKEAQEKKDDDEVKRLTAKLQEQQQAAQQLAEQLSRDRAGRAGEPLQQAARQMEEAVKRLSRGENADQQQQEALDRINEARRELERKQRETEEELARQQLERVAEVVKRLAERQEGMNKRAQRIQDEVEQDGKWTPAGLDDLMRLQRAQIGLSGEARSTAEKELSGAQIFRRVLEKSADAMKRASERMSALHKRIPKDVKDTTFDPEARYAQEEALRRLRQLVEALKPDELVAMRPPQQPDGGGGQPGGGGGQSGGRQNPGDNVPPLAELKLLRSIETDIKQRFKELRSKQPDATKLTKEQEEELSNLRREQREVAEMLEAFLEAQQQAAPPAGEGEIE